MPPVLFSPFRVFIFFYLSFLGKSFRKNIACVTSAADDERLVTGDGSSAVRTEEDLILNRYILYIINYSALGNFPLILKMFLIL